MKKSFIAVLVVVLSLLIFCGIGVLADDLDELQDKQKELNQNIQNTQEEINSVTTQKNATMEQLEVIEGQLKTLGEEIAALEKDLAQAEIDLANQQKEYDRIQAELEEAQSSMQDRVRGIYVNGDISYWDIIFKSESVQDFLSNYVYFEKITEQDQETIGTIQENKRLAKELLDQLQATKDSIQKMTDSKKVQEAQFQQQQAEKQSIMASLESQEDTLMEVLGAFEEESDRVAAEIQKLTQDSDVVYTGNGIFGWPLPGHNVGSGQGSKFGMRVHPVTGVYKLHTGVDIPASTGTPIRAAEAGKVITASYKGAYGNCVIIDHGNGYSTLYGHQSSIGVSVGETVARGQTIGYVGSTGYSTGPHLHFEVRVNGTPQDPLKYATPN
ncbi:MAG: peptidoglycan DD-metalloendopeptidase family protein [Bacillota bacterium]|nr:peptidoglycan DD-metalloendopeptidase family protein [Bacillota bacterium]